MPEVNKYTLELAIDQYKLKNGQKVDFSVGEIGLEYGSQRFITREQAENWMRAQEINRDSLMKDVRMARRRAKETGKERDELEDLFQIFEDFYTKELAVRRESAKQRANLRTETIKVRSKQVPVVEIPILDPLNLSLLGIQTFTIGKVKVEVYGNEIERILPLTDASIEKHDYTYDELGEFVRQSILSLSGKEITPEVARDIARRVVRIEGKGGFLSKVIGTGFVMNGKIYTNDHVVRGVKDIRVFDLTGEELPFGKIKLKFDNGTDPLRDFTTIELPEEIHKQYLGYPRLGIPEGYIFGLKGIHESITPGNQREGTGLWIQRADIQMNSRYYDKYKGEFIYSSSSNTIAGTSGSIVYQNGYPIGLNSHGDYSTRESEYHKLYGIIPIGSFGGEIKGTQRVKNNKPKSGGGVFLDEVWE